MPEEPKDLGAVWRNQSAEKLAVDPGQFANRRTRELYSATRSEILMSIGAALFFVAVMATRFASAQDRLQQLELPAVLIWVVISLYWFRERIFRRASPPAAPAAPGLEYYRKELERRRDHLRSEWLWHGPLVLACVIFAATVIGRAYPGRLRNVLPLVVLLAAWAAFSVRRRRRQATELQREIDDLRAV
jgi:hypothetical protein